MLEVIDGRDDRSHPHECGGVWQSIGPNKGGHELYRCDTEGGGHIRIGGQQRPLA